MTEKEEFLELYKVFVGTITANEQRRQQLAAFYLSLLVAGVAALGAIKDIDPLFILAPAFVISIVWHSSIRYFRRLSKAKFKVIAEMENQFSIRPFQLEWKFYKEQHESEDIKTKKRRFGLAHLDMIVPFLSALVCGLYLLFRLLLLFN